MNNSIYVILLIMLLVSCSREANNKFLKYENIVILSDLSNRLDKLPQKDTSEIFKIVNYFRNECVKPGEKIGDKSCLCFSPLSQSLIACVDINQIKSLGDKQSFINSTGKYKGNGLDQLLMDFKDSVISIYKTTRDPGLDLISLLSEKIEKGLLIKDDTYITDGIDTTFIKYDNHIYIFTDGYLEYRNKQLNDQFYFSHNEIERVRQYCIANKVDILTALMRDKLLGLPPYYRKRNRIINLHILETHERDKDLKFKKYNHPTGQRDNEILEAVWRKWAKESGFKSLEWDKY